MALYRCGKCKRFFHRWQMHGSWCSGSEGESFLTRYGICKRCFRKEKQSRTWRIEGDIRREFGGLDRYE